MNKFIMLIGLPSSGKSTIANKMKDKNNIIISSDELRKELTGGYYPPNFNNSKLFDILTSESIINLMKGKNVIFDSTNLSAKNRIKILNKIKETLNIEVEYEALVIATPYNDCIESDSKREKKVGNEVISAMRKMFEMPYYTEGFNKIEIQFSKDNYMNPEDRDLTRIEYVKTHFDINQDNHNHTLTLSDHCIRCAHTISNNKIVKNFNELTFIEMAGLFHDIGKKYTKSFSTFDGKDSEEAHYYGHENVSAYEVMFLFPCSTEKLIKICNLIQYHMRMYFIKSEKSKQKLISCIGIEMYNWLEILHDGDKLAR